MKLNTKGVQLIDRSEWIINEGSHPPLETEEEHQQIMAIFESRRLRPKGSRRNIQVFLKLIYFGKCGKIMSFIDKNDGKVFVKTCMKSDNVGHKCGNCGVDVEVVYAQLFFDLKQYESELLSNNDLNDTRHSSALRTALNNKQEELAKLFGRCRPN